MTRFNLLLLLTMLALPLYGQPIPGADGECTQVTHYRDNAHWERKSYTYSGNRVLTMAVYGPSGLIDTLSLQKADTSGRAGQAPLAAYSLSKLFCIFVP